MYTHNFQYCSNNVTNITNHQCPPMQSMLSKPFTIKLLTTVLCIIFTQYLIDDKKHQLRLLRQESASNRRKKTRIKWSEINQRISDRHFRRMFRMTRVCFSELCCVIICNIGESKFKSEEYIDAFLDNPYYPLASQQVNMHRAHVKTSGG